MKTTPHDLNVRRAAPPAVLFPSDIAVALGISLEVADAQTSLGRFGPCFYVGGRAAVLRDDFFPTLAKRAARVDPTEKEVLVTRRTEGASHAAP